MVSFSNMIGGNLILSTGKEVIYVSNPVNQEVVGTVQKGTREDAMNALKAAQAAQPEWAKLTAKRRGDYLIELAGILDEHKEELADLLTTEHGKPLHEARGEVEGAAGFLRYAAESARRIEGEILTSDMQDEQAWIQRVPYGVTVGIVAWNFPLALAARKDWKCLGLRKYDGGKAAIRNTFNCYEICGADSKGKQFAKGRFKLCYRFRQGCWGCIGKK